MNRTNDNFRGLNLTLLPGYHDNSSLLNCPTLTEEDKNVFRIVSYWVGGVGISCVAIPGLAMNLTAIFMLLKTVSNKNIFNPLIASLCIFDSVFLVLHIIDVFRKYFNVEEKILVTLFPRIIYPVRSISFTASIFMTVAIAYERYSAIKYPLQHHQSLRSRKFRRIALFKYIFFVTCFAVLFNIPKFFETQVKWRNSTDTPLNNNTTNHTQR